MIDGDLAERAERLRAERAPFALATVVRAQHPTSVVPGDAAIVAADGSIDGFVGGLCAEASVRLQALRTLETGEAVLLRILPPGGEEVELGGPAAELEGSVTVENPCLSGGAMEIFIEPCQPRPLLAVVGATPIARALADLGERLGYEVRVGDAALEPQPDLAALVVASHGRDEERPLAAALGAGVPYVALVASPKRGEAVRTGLEVPDALREQLRTPAGLEIGARTPAEIALSILAEILARRGATPAPARSAAGEAGPKLTVDPICGMAVAASDASIQLDAGGQRFYFCSEGCRDSFAADAARHADLA
ncbi:MAG: XdhC family protein [Solirubrobacterales bacterium]